VADDQVGDEDLCGVRGQEGPLDGGWSIYKSEFPARGYPPAAEIGLTSADRD